MNTRVNKLKPGEIIPLNFDYVFNNIFNNENNIDILENFLAIYFDRPLSDIKGHIKLKSREIPTENKKQMDNQVDILLDMDGKTINIELNNNSSKKVLERNIVYASKIHGKMLKYGDKNYSKIGYTHQINLNNFRCNEHDIKEKYYFRNEYGNILSEKIEIDLLDIELSRDKSYNKYNEKLTKLLRAIVSVKKDDLVKEIRGVMEKDIEEKLVEQVDEYSSDEEVIKLYSKYTKAELERNTLIEEAKEIAQEEGFKEGHEKGFKQGIEQGIEQGIQQGIQQGIEQGINERNIDIAKNMLKENINNLIISNVTGLNIDEINKIKNDL